MSQHKWYESNRMLVLLVGLIATSAWGVGEAAAYMPTPDADAVTMLTGIYIGGESLVAAAKAWRAKEGA